MLQQGQAIGSGTSVWDAQRADPTIAPPNAPPTLARAISSLADLNKKLGILGNSAYRLAEVVGGPYPVGGGENTPEQAKPPSAMHVLNDEIDRAHRQVGDINRAVEAMQRSLGAP